MTEHLLRKTTDLENLKQAGLKHQPVSISAADMDLLQNLQKLARLTGCV